MLKTGVSPFCSYVLWVGSLPNSCTKSCSLLSGALYCFITSTGYGTVLPFVLRPLSTKSGPRVTGNRDLTMISSYYWQTLSRSNELPPQHKSWSLSLSYPSWVHSESVRVMLQKGDQYQTCRKPSHKTREQNDVNTALFLFEPLQRSQLSHVTKGEIAETQPERRKPFKLQCLNAFLL